MAIHTRYYSVYRYLISISAVSRERISQPNLVATRDTRNFPPVPLFLTINKRSSSMSTRFGLIPTCALSIVAPIETANGGAGTPTRDNAHAARFLPPPRLRSPFYEPRAFSRAKARRLLQRAPRRCRRDASSHT